MSSMCRGNDSQELKHTYHLTNEASKKYKFCSLHFALLPIQAVQWYSYCIFWHLTCTACYQKEKFIHVNI